MKVLIIEDEVLAQEYLEKLLYETEFEIDILETCNSLKSAITWLIKNEEPDLIFMDIDLGDGLCFEIFDVVPLSCSIIFTTAYDEYAIQAFKVNSVDYLLKPISLKDLLGALSKYARLGAFDNQHQKVDQVVRKLSGRYKSRFMIKVGQHIKSIQVKDIHFFISRDKATYAIGKDGKSYLLDYSLDNLESIMDPNFFFRINRNYIINFSAIKDIISYSGSRLKVILHNHQNEDVIISRERVNTFKAWLDR